MLERAAGDGQVGCCATKRPRPMVSDVASFRRAGREKKLSFPQGPVRGLVDRFFNVRLPLFTRSSCRRPLAEFHYDPGDLLVGLGAALASGLPRGIILPRYFRNGGDHYCCDGEVARLTFTNRRSGLARCVRKCGAYGYLCRHCRGSYCVWWERRCVGSACRFRSVLGMAFLLVTGHKD